jgi:pSer/pThr/pTyr-binding forkhead associated (FHA) protein
MATIEVVKSGIAGVDEGYARTVDEPLTIGTRDPDTRPHLQLIHDLLSPTHCTIRKDGQGYRLSDSSDHGTYIENRGGESPVSNRGVVLKHRQLFWLAAREVITFRFLDPDKPPVSQPRASFRISSHSPAPSRKPVAVEV